MSAAAAASATAAPVVELPWAWAEITHRAPKLAETMTAYLEELSGRLSAGSVASAESCLRQFALHVIATDSFCTSAADVTAIHVGSWCVGLSARWGSRRKRPVTAATINHKLDVLRRFFEHIRDAGYPDAPEQLPIFRPPRKPRRPKPNKAAKEPTPSRAVLPEISWDQIAARAPQMAATMEAYLDQISVSQRATSVGAASLALRHLAAYLIVTEPDCSSVASITRSHIEGYKLALAARPGQKGTISKTDYPPQPGHGPHLLRADHRLGLAGRPRRVPIFAGDIPKADEPLPKFLDDPTAAKFMATLAVDPDRRRRLLVELLARTGMRAGELGGIRDDAMYRVGDTWWLRIPIGKLHNDRNVPLHPLLVGLISDYQAWRGPSRNGYLLEREDGQPFDRRTIHRYVERVAKRAGVGPVHPHQLRHTLATQCQVSDVAAGASLDLLGDRCPVRGLGLSSLVAVG